MPHKEKISINEIIDLIVSVWKTTTKSSKVRYKLYANIYGDKRRKTKHSLEQAKATATEWYMDYVELSNASRRLPTCLTEEQLRDAEEALAKAASSEQLAGKRLVTIVEMFAASLVPMPRVSLPKAIDDFMDHKHSENLNAKDLRDYQKTFDRLRQSSPSIEYLDDIRPNHITRYLSQLNRDMCSKQKLSPEGNVIYSDATYNKHVGRLKTFFYFCEGHYIDQQTPASPFQNFQKRTVSEKAIDYYSPEEGQVIMNLAEVFEDGALVSYFRYTLLLPIRPDYSGEILRLAPFLENEKYLDLNARTLTIPGCVSKTGKKRKVELLTPFLRYNLRYPLENYPLIPTPRDKVDSKRSPETRLKNALERFRRFYRKQTGREWIHDGLRHTYITYRLHSTGSYYTTAQESGNSETVIKNNYDGLSDAETAKRFWTISPFGWSEQSPDSDNSNLVMFDDSGFLPQGHTFVYLDEDLPDDDYPPEYYEDMNIIEIDDYEPPLDNVSDLD